MTASEDKLVDKWVYDAAETAAYFAAEAAAHAAADSTAAAYASADGAADAARDADAYGNKKSIWGCIKDAYLAASAAAKSAGRGG